VLYREKWPNSGEETPPFISEGHTSICTQNEDRIGLLFTKMRYRLMHTRWNFHLFNEKKMVFTLHW
jgi:hypothetical protein